MPRGLKRFPHAGCLHFITFSCKRRTRLLDSPRAKQVFEEELERTRRWYGFFVTGYVVMPEHVHLLISEPERKELSVAIQMLKQNVARRLARGPMWQVRYYDFLVHRERKRIEKLRYMHRNPVKRGLVLSPEEWAWSSFRHYATGSEGRVEIESEWTGRRRERMGVRFSVKVNSHPVVPKAGTTRVGHPQW